VQIFPHDVNIIEPRDNYIYELDHWRAKEGDDPQWRLDTALDSTWTELPAYKRTAVHGIGWAQTTVTISRPVPANKYLALFPDRIVSAYDLYWDGMYISSNGTVADVQEREVVGRYFSLVQIPQQYSAPGRHTVALRVSNWNVASRWEHGQLFFGYYDAILKLVYTWQVRIYFLLGIVFLAMCLNIFLSFTSQRRSTHLLFGIFCLAIFLSLLFNYYWTIADVSNYYLDYRNVIVPLTLVLIGIALPVFFLFEFAFPYTAGATLAIVLMNGIAFSASRDSDTLNAYVFYLLIGNVVFLTLWGVTRRREGTVPVLVGTAASILISWADFRFGVDNVTIFSSSIIICYTYILAKQFSRNERQKQEALVRSIRLENQLLKRSINPHSLLNSLTSIIVWLKKEPAVAIQLVESLSEEFRIVSQIANLQMISIKTEIDLCQTHLRIMSFRRKAKFTLEHHDIDFGEEIPPMIFHTLIENGITHAYENRSEGRFVLRRTLLPDGVQYSVFNDGRAGDDGVPHPIGTGFKYIKARLEESYPGRWSFDYGNVEKGFEAHIALYHHAKKGR
jgi:hypothetical protein